MPRYRAQGPAPVSFLDWLIGLMFSLKFGLILLVIMTVVSIIGTLLPPPSPDISQLEHAQNVIFYTGWFQVLMLLLMVNMLLATWRNLTRKVIPAMGPLVIKSPLYYENTEPSEELPAGDPERVDEAFRKAGYKVARSGRFATATRGELSRWGAPLAHLGMAVVLLGGAASRWTASEGAVRLLEGGQTSQMMMTTGDSRQPVPLGFTLIVDDFDTAFFPKTRIPSHFVSTVTIEQVGRAPRTGPVEVNQSMKANGWKLHQTSYQEVPGGTRFMLTINGPDLPTSTTLEISPGQTRPVPGVEGMDLSVGPVPPFSWKLLRDGEPVQQGKLSVETISLEVRADQFEPDFVIGSDRKVGSRSQELNNPALRVTLLQGGQEIDRQWLFGSEDMKAMMHGGQSDYELELTGIEGPPESRIFHVDIRNKQTGMSLGHVDLSVGDSIKLGAEDESVESEPEPAEGPWRVEVAKTVPIYSTTITLTRNAAVPVVYFGCFLMIIGLLLAFFIQRREVFMRQDGDNGPVRLVGVYRHAQNQFDPATRAVINRLKESAHAPYSGRMESSKS